VLVSPAFRRRSSSGIDAIRAARWRILSLPDGAVVIDSTGLTVESVVDRILAVARRRLSASL
jgi:hypothetical protein